MLKIIQVSLLICFSFLLVNAHAEEQKQRVIVLTDMGADPDDRQSLVRLLVYANKIDIEGLIPTTSVWRQNVIKPEFIEKTLDSYEKVRDNLNLHEPGYPTADLLRSKIRLPKVLYGMDAIGEGKSSPASDLIIEQLQNDDPRPLWISVWGGVSVLGQALFTLQQTSTAAELAKHVAKLRVYSISDQDNSATWIRETFPDLFYIVSPGDDYLKATWISISRQIEGIDNTNVSNAWISENIQQNHGPLGTDYPDIAWGMEGDTPSFMYLIPNGLNSPEHPNWGSWGGRYELRIPAFETITDGHSEIKPEPVTRPIWTDTQDSWTPYVLQSFGRAVTKMDKQYTGNRVTLWRWREDFQNDFAARMDWSVKNYADANHPPLPQLTHPNRLEVTSGDIVTLDAGESTDPDGDSLSYLWFNYPEAGSYQMPISIEGAENIHHVEFKAPDVDTPQTAHFILRLTDKGTPRLSRYQRVIVNINPR